MSGIWGGLSSEQFTNNRKGVRISDYATDYIYQGKCHYIHDVYDIPLSSSIIFMHELNGNLSDRSLSLYPPLFAGKFDGVVTVYAGTDYTGGALDKRS